MTAGLVTASNLGTDFDFGTQVPNKLNIFPASTTVPGKMRFATAAEILAAATGVVADASQVVLLTAGSNGVKGFTLGAPQAAAGQVAQISAPYTSALLNTKQDILRIAVGAMPPSMEFDSLPGTGATNTATTAITALLAVPAGTYNGNATWPDAAIQSVVANYSTSKSGIPFLGVAGIAAANAFVEAFNGVVGNAAPGTLSKDGNGFDFAHLYASEMDVNLYAKTAAAATTATAATTASITVAVASVAGIVIGQSVMGVGVLAYPVTTVIGISGTTLTLSQPATIANSATLAFGTAPSGDVAAYSAYISGNINTLGNTIAYWTRGGPVAKWNFAHATDNGAANVFALIGAQSTIGPSNGQPIIFKAVGGNGALGSGGTDLLAGRIYADAAGYMHYAAYAGLAFDAPIVAASSLQVAGEIYLGTPAAAKQFVQNGGGYTVVYDDAGNNTIQLGDGLAYLQSGTFTFRSLDQSKNYLTIDVNGLEIVKGFGAFGAAPPPSKPTVSGAKSSNAALASLIAALASYGLINDSTT